MALRLAVVENFSWNDVFIWWLLICWLDSLPSSFPAKAFAWILWLPVGGVLARKPHLPILLVDLLYPLSSLSAVIFLVVVFLWEWVCALWFVGLRLFLKDKCGKSSRTSKRSKLEMRKNVLVKFNFPGNCWSTKTSHSSEQPIITWGQHSSGKPSFTIFSKQSEGKQAFAVLWVRGMRWPNTLSSFQCRFEILRIFVWHDNHVLSCSSPSIFICFTGQVFLECART